MPSAQMRMACLIRLTEAKKLESEWQWRLKRAARLQKKLATTRGLHSSSHFWREEERLIRCQVNITEREREGKKDKMIILLFFKRNTAQCKTSKHRDSNDGTISTSKSMTSSSRRSTGYCLSLKKLRKKNLLQCMISKSVPSRFDLNLFLTKALFLWMHLVSARLFVRESEDQRRMYMYASEANVNEVSWRSSKKREHVIGKLNLKWLSTSIWDVF